MKYHLLLKTTVNVVLDVEAANPREAAEKLLDTKFIDIGDILYQDSSVWKSGVETSWDDGGEFEVEVSPIDPQDGPDYEKADYFTAMYPGEPTLKENIEGKLVHIRVEVDGHTREVVEVPDKEGNSG